MRQVPASVVRSRRSSTNFQPDGEMTEQCLGSLYRALPKACENGHAECVKLLIDSKANALSSNDHGTTTVGAWRRTQAEWAKLRSSERVRKTTW
jgi:hypothetical protein